MHCAANLFLLQIISVAFFLLSYCFVSRCDKIVLKILVYTGGAVCREILRKLSSVSFTYSALLPNSHVVLCNSLPVGVFAGCRPSPSHALPSSRPTHTTLSPLPPCRSFSLPPLPRCFLFYCCVRLLVVQSLLVALAGCGRHISLCRHHHLAAVMPKSLLWQRRHITATAMDS